MMTRDRLSLAILLAFTILLAFAYRNRPGVDLTSSYLGGRAFVTGQTAHLYSQDPVFYNLVSDPVWRQLADGHGFAPHAYLPPYVQTPLWGYILQPLCRSMSFPAFNRLFQAVIALCFGAMIWLTIVSWAPELRRPGWVALVCAIAFAAPAVRYSMQLSQTHIIFILMALLAVVLARSGRPILAGSLLAFAVAVKVTPALLLIYWLMTRQTRAAISFIVTSAALLAVTVAMTGPALVAAYFHSLSSISHILLVSANNQSFAAFWMGNSFPRGELNLWHSFTLPPGIRAASLALLVASGIAGGYLDLKLFRLDPQSPPFGALITLIGATVFTPIAWSHYFAILLIPIMLLLDETVRRRSNLLRALTAVILAFTLYSAVAPYLPGLEQAAPELVRNQFNAAIVALAALIVLQTKRSQAARQALVSGRELPAHRREIHAA